MGQEGMIAYEFYCFDDKSTNEAHFFGIIPERRKNPIRITRESVLNLGRRFIGDHSDVNNLYFIQIEVHPRYLSRDHTIKRI